MVITFLPERHLQPDLLYIRDQFLRPASGRFRKFVELDQSKGIGGRVWPRRSRFGYWFGRLTTIGGEIDDNGV